MVSSYVIDNERIERQKTQMKYVQDAGNVAKKTSKTLRETSECPHVVVEAILG